MASTELMRPLQSSTPQTSLARRSTLIKFNPRQRWSCCGKTGTGKTVWEKWWLAHWYAGGWPILVIDIKRKFAPLDELAREPELATLEHPYSIDGSAQLIPGCRVMVYHPSIPGWKDERLNNLLLQVLARGNMVVAFDEVNGVADESHQPLGMLLLLTQGRESDIPTLCCFQKPVRIPVDLLEQSEWWAVFRVNTPRYRDKLVEMTGFPELEYRPTEFHYWLANESWDAPVMMAPVPWPGAREHGSKVVGASSRRLLDQTDAGGGQSRRQAPGTRQRRQAGAEQVQDHAATAHAHSRIHARASRRAAAG